MSDEEHKASDTGDEHGDDHMVFDEERSLKQAISLIRIHIIKGLNPLVIDQFTSYWQPKEKKCIDSFHQS
ncbi:hypothetical protein L1987_25192 [Smallanthus sonchifolius]|uniref:Uncharacterized protein n=1 Tax=Smallanthus sonchifolius TaxID=185202 RepID=A0ACB9IN47_9ASTR|nr:hypothetical protein L1987_25192 [Smallanthus sonchifolius]